MKICLVANEILGAHKNGGIGTTTSHLALLLARHGHAVTLFYVGYTPLDPSSAWASHYEAAGIKVRHHPVSSLPMQPHWMKQPVEVFEQLRYLEFDVILFQDWMALGHSCVIAKRAGLAFGKTTLAIVSHSSTAWLLEANRGFPRSIHDLAIIHMEKQAIELADCVVVPSDYLRQWMYDAGWTLPDNTCVIPYFLAGLEACGGGAQVVGAGRERAGAPSHLVFFGRLETRKGIDIFLAAIAADALKPFRFKLTFLGRPASRSMDDIRRFVAAHRPDLLPHLRFEPDLSSDEAQALLCRTDCVPVMPSLTDNSPCVVYECLRLGLPFLASASGGTAELIHAADRDRCLFQPTAPALAQKLREVLASEGRFVPRAANDEHEIGRRWLAWFAAQAPRTSSMAIPRVAPGAADITVIITHFERPHLVEQTLRALAMQTDPNFDIILVDDGSTSDAALAFLARTRRGIAGLSIDVVRQSNKYLGAARNAGIRRAASRFVIFLDDDNIPFPTMVEMFRRAAHCSGADIVTCQMQSFHDATGDPDYWNLVSGERWAFSGGPAALGLVQNCFGDATAIYKREIFERIGYFHEISGVTHEDWQMHLRATLEGLDLLSLPLPLFWYRVAPGSMSRTTDRYRNTNVVADCYREKLPPGLSQMVDFVIGMHFPE